MSALGRISVQRGAALAWRMKQAVQRVGAPGMVAIVLATACSIAYLFTLQPLLAEIAVTRAQWRLVSNRTVAPPMANASLDGMSAFYASVPEIDEQFSLMARLHRAASTQGLLLEHGDYQFVPELATPLIRYEIELPVRGEYTQVRRFISAAMRDMPTLALKGVSFSRQKSDDPQLNAKISFVLYLKKDRT
ncbi:hypothetical protein GTP91_24835 [Rugamonas sp. FT82W]|uniref:Type 4a pilus biogenesis protein PilO n=1 Tax=Duganella vulcania TaxID=2692166 RepID=A0A845GAF8_9BURK|nr:hypothetical protein [Duganella vulcania]MYM90385.1 hypothetical protein [Duganella vulcania]